MRLNGMRSWAVTEVDLRALQGRARTRDGHGASLSLAGASLEAATLGAVVVQR